MLIRWSLQNFEVESYIWPMGAAKKHFGRGVLAYRNTNYYVDVDVDYVDVDLYFV